MGLIPRETPHVGYYRTPAIYGERLVFSCADDLWEVSLRGGRATSLMTGPGSKIRPAFSPDGQWLSYSSNESGSQEIHLASLVVKSSRQFTSLGSVSRNIGWRGTTLLFTSQAQLPFQSALWLFSASLETPYAQQIPWGPVSSASFHPRGACIIGRHEITEASSRKRYRGGAAGDLWIDRKGDGQFAPLIALPGNLTRPCWVGDRVYFLSDHEGCGNVYSCNAEGSDLKKHTQHTAYVRGLSTDGQTLVYACDAELYHLEPAAFSGRMIEIECERAQPKRKTPAVLFLEDFDFSAETQDLAFVSRGRGILADGREFGEAAERIRFIRWLEPSRWLAIVSTGLSEYIGFLNPEKSQIVPLVHEDLGRTVGLQISPDRRFLALANDRQELLVISLASGSVLQVDRSPFGEIAGFDWSANSQSLAYSLPLNADTSSLRLFDLASREVKTLSSPGYRISSPCFDPAKPYLYFLAEGFFETPTSSTGNSLSVRTRPCAALLTFEGANPQAAIRVLPLPAANYSSLAFSQGALFYQRSSTSSSKDNSLYRYDFVEESLVSEDVSSWRAQNEQICYRRGGLFYTYPRQELLFDLRTLEVNVSPSQEWRQMFDETWRGQRDHFWRKKDVQHWEVLRDRQSHLIDRVTTRSEFSDLTLELLGEVETSHAYSGYIDRETKAPRQIGFLGADFELNNNGRFTITRLLRGDLWDRETSSPLAQPELGLREGDVLLTVEDREIDPRENWAHLIRADKDLQLTFAREAAVKKVVIKPIRNEVSLRQADWVRRSQELVRIQSDDRCGYLQIPNTHANGFAEFYRQYLGQCSKQALIIDARYSSGGNTAEFILDRLNRRKLGEIHARWSDTSNFPSACPPSVLLLLINEYTGSDSEVFAHSFRQLGLGPLIGKRTWGGIFGYKSRLLARDGGFTTRPQTAFLLEDVGGAIENHGVQPDIVVEFRPQDHANRHDPQLARAIEEAVGRMGKREF